MYNKLHEIDYHDNQSVEIKVSMETPKVSMATAPTPHAGVCILEHATEHSKFNSVGPMILTSCQHIKST